MVTESELKRLFWIAARQVHPDLSGKDSTLFVSLKRDYDEASALLKRDPGALPSRGGCVDRASCEEQFIELLSSNFPADQRVRAKNGFYRKRILRLNADLGVLDGRMKDLFLAFEEELYRLKGPSVVSNHPYGLVKLFLYRYADYLRLPNRVNRNFLLQGYRVVVDVLESRGMTHSLAFIAWLTEGCAVQK